jgi:hypothetical protein
VIVVDGLDLPDGTPVTVAANGERETECELSAEELAELDAAISEADADETIIPHESVLAEPGQIIANR